MILNAAGHGGLVNPIVHNNAAQRLPAWAWGAIGLSVAVHVAAGAWLYQQRFATPEPETVDRDPHIIDVVRLPAPKPEVEPQATPQKPTKQIRESRPLPLPAPVDPLPVPANPLGQESGEITLTPPQTVEPVTAGGSGNGEVAAPSGPARIDKPSWIQMPTADQMERHYPRRALENGTTGSAVLRCAVTITGNVSACSVISETPAGEGFGAAALKLSRYFRMSPKAVDGKAVGGAIVDVKLAFTLN